MSARLKKREETKEEAAPIMEQPHANVVVEFPQAEIIPAIVEAAPDEEYGDKPGQNDGYGYRVPSPDALAVDYDSIKLAELEQGALLRIFRDRFCGLCKYYMSPEGGGYPAEGAARLAQQRYGNKTPAEVMEELLGYSVESVSFHQLHELWDCSPEDAERYFGMVKNEAQKEFATGHLAAKVFEPVDWMNTVWNRAQFLALRDTYLAEFVPEGGIEYSLVDMLVQCYFMQQYWMEQTVERTKTDPRRESYEYAKWQEYQKRVAKAEQWDNPTHWQIPYANQLQCIENAANMVALFSSLYQKTLRQLNAHRMLKFKLLKLKAETRRINALTRQTIKCTQDTNYKD